MKCISPFLKMQRVFSSLPSAGGDFSTPGMGALQAENQLKRDCDHSLISCDVRAWTSSSSHSASNMDVPWPASKNDAQTTAAGCYELLIRKAI
jgi:hypothetical protein